MYAVVFGPEDLASGVGRRVRGAITCYESLVEELEPVARETYDGAVAAIEVSDVGRDLGAFILDPALPLRLHLPLRPLLRFNRMLTVGMLPPLVASAVRVLLVGRRRRTLRALLWLARRHVRRFDARPRRSA